MKEKRLSCRVVIVSKLHVLYNKNGNIIQQKKINRNPAGLRFKGWKRVFSRVPESSLLRHLKYLNQTVFPSVPGHRLQSHYLRYMLST